jgi:hypothetical protein
VRRRVRATAAAAVIWFTMTQLLVPPDPDRDGSLAEAESVRDPA